jgi:hypothetical protein
MATKKTKKVSKPSLSKKDIKAGFKSRAKSSKADLKLSEQRNLPFVESIISDDIIPKKEKSHLKKVSKGKSKGKYISEAAIEHKRKKQAFTISQMSAHMTDIGINIKNDDFDAFDLFAQHLISLLQNQIHTIANLNKHERFIVLRYFYKTNPILGRILDLHTEIPLSKLRLQAPRGVPKIVKDFVLQFYNRLFDKLNIAQFLKDWFLQRWIYGESYGLVDDHFGDYDYELQEIKNLEENEYNRSEESKKKIEEIENKYRENPDSVSIEERREYLKLKFMNFFQFKYRGPDRIKALKFYQITEYFENEDIDFEAIRYEFSSGLKNLIVQNRKDDRLFDDLKELGYSDGMLALMKESEDFQSVVIDNDPYSGFPFIFSMTGFERISPVERVLDALLEWDAAKKAIKARIRTIGKVGRIITAEDLSEDQVEALRAEVEQMLEDPTYAIVANYSISWEEVQQELKEELSNLSDATDKIISELGFGLGMPDSLMTGDSQYAGDNIKVEIMNTQYMAIKISVQDILESKLLKPIALRKGLISVDSWGNPFLVYPKVTFGQTNLRSDEYFDILFSLYQKGSLNVDVIYDLLNLDGDDVVHALEEDLWTLKNDKFNEVIGNIFNDVSDTVIESTDVTNKVIAGLGLATTTEGIGDEDEEDPDPRRRF